MAVLVKVLIVLALVAGLLALFSVSVLGLSGAQLAGLGVVALALAALL